MIIAINYVIVGFRWVDLVWLATSDYSQLSNYSCTEWVVKNRAANAPITFEEIVMVMIKQLIHERALDMSW